MAVVHSFTVYDIVSDTWQTQPMKSSAERISRVGGEIIAGTEETVEDDQLDAEGRFSPDV